MRSDFGVGGSTEQLRAVGRTRNEGGCDKLNSGKNGWEVELEINGLTSKELVEDGGGTLFLLVLGTITCEDDADAGSSESNQCVGGGKQGGIVVQENVGWGVVCGTLCG